MKPSKLNNVQIHITTYKKDSLKNDLKNMNEDKSKRYLNSKHICSVCLNSKLEDKLNENNKLFSKSCPICQKSCGTCLNKTQRPQNHTEKAQKVHEMDKSRNTPRKKHTETKSVQTVQTDMNKSLNLLNEVLTVFQSKKIERVKSKTIILKDASVSTDDVRKLNSKLSVSKVFQLSIDYNKVGENGKFVVMSSKTDDDKRSHIDLLKHKSSSIPQMRLEELKYSLKEKTKSKDVIEEVNRMFATVKRKNYDKNDLNRPSIRSGPRILPVVETIADHNEKFLKESETKVIQKQSCKCCQTNNCMSSGDSIKCCQPNESERSDKSQCCHKKDRERCEKCVYMLCCHYKNRRQMKGVMVCERCRDVKEFPWKYSEHSFDDNA